MQRKPRAPRKMNPNTSWMNAALCKGTDPDVFFPEDHHDVAKAKEVCSRCPVVHLCLEYAIENKEFDRLSVWGGTTGIERRKMQRERRKAI
jgi:WhiB family transcriptional regulator, redox-sensing transcriptional regulator